jgi:hypothetical protein
MLVALNKEPAGDPPARENGGCHFTLTAARKHFVQSTLVCLRFPCQTATFWRVGRNDRWVARFENERL